MYEIADFIFFCGGVCVILFIEQFFPEGLCRASDNIAQSRIIVLSIEERFCDTACDSVIAEGWKYEDLTKIGVTVIFANRRRFIHEHHKTRRLLRHIDQIRVICIGSQIFSSKNSRIIICNGWVICL